MKWLSILPSQRLTFNHSRWLRSWCESRICRGRKIEVPKEKPQGQTEMDKSQPMCEGGTDDHYNNLTPNPL